MNAVAPRRVEVVNFGCRLNLVEGEAMRRVAGVAGDLTVVNTCAVTGEAVRQARQAIRRLKREAPQRDIVVTGCAAHIRPELFAAMPEVAKVLGNAEKLDPTAFATGRRVEVGDIFARPYAWPAGGEIEGRTRAFLAVQNGCDHRCTFCIIPYGRGASRSMPPKEILAAVETCVEKGAKEIVLTGVDLTAYGRDFGGGPKLGGLVKAILRAAPTLPRLRLSSIDCIETDAEFVEAMQNEPRLMPHLHLSLQSGDDMILKRMKRRHSRADAIRFCAALRRVRPDIVFGADLIAGFPTETDKMFENTLALVEECALTHLHVFAFSARPGTPAANMPQLAPHVIATRARRLRQAGEVSLARHLTRQVGRTLTLLTEQGDTARAGDFTKVRLRDVSPGRLVTARIVGQDGKMLVGCRETV